MTGSSSTLDTKISSCCEQTQLVSQTASQSIDHIHNLFIYIDRSSLRPWTAKLEAPRQKAQWILGDCTMHGAVAVILIVQCPTSTLWITIAPQNVPQRTYFCLKTNQKLRRHKKKIEKVRSMRRIVTPEENLCKRHSLRVPSRSFMQTLYCTNKAKAQAHDQPLCQHVPWCTFGLCPAAACTAWAWPRAQHLPACMSRWWVGYSYPLFQGGQEFRHVEENVSCCVASLPEACPGLFFSISKGMA